MGWKDGGIVDLFGLILFLDATTPPIFNKMGTVGWVPTLTLTSHIRNILSLVLSRLLQKQNLLRVTISRKIGRFGIQVGI